MAEECTCREAIAYTLDDVRRQARRVEADYDKRLNAFRDGISQGAREVAARHLYLAGVYAASLDNRFTKNPSEYMIRQSLIQRLQDNNVRTLDFYRANVRLIEEQNLYIDLDRVLRGVLRERKRAPGLLEARIRSELRQAETSLGRLEKLERYLTSWRENIRLETQIRIEEITDMHNS